jgi:predicted NUDIX family phosphoesterase
MKYPQHILASHTATLKASLAMRHVVPDVAHISGIVGSARETMLDVLGDNVYLARRQELEGDEKFRQWLPYYVFLRQGENGPEVFMYQRSKQQGETRLLGKCSIGLGGHMDLVDVRHQDSVIDVAMTLAVSGRRELDEEIMVSANGSQFYGWSAYVTGNRAMANFTAFILDDSDAVGRVHVGLVHVIEVPANLELECKDDGNVGKGFIPVARLLEHDLENWSRLLAMDPHYLLA